MLKKLVLSLLDKLGYAVLPLPRNIADRGVYRPFYSPWFAEGEFRRYYELAAPRTLVSPESCHVIYTLLRQAAHVEGDVWECGVYKGGTAAMEAAILRDKAPTKKLYLFDTFEGMPETDAEKDWHKGGDFADTSLEAVAGYVKQPDICVFRKGFIPDTFAGLESARIAFAHIDVDIYKSILDCLEFIWPRLSTGGFIVFDDYGFPTCPGARKAVDEFFSKEACVPLCLSTGQALAFKGAVIGQPEPVKSSFVPS
jgi:O-methyltransferase